jgi:hypothetical protein
MKRRLATEDADLIPVFFRYYAFCDEVLNLGSRHLFAGWRLLTGSIAVETTQIAGPSQVDFKSTAAASKFWT